MKLVHTAMNLSVYITAILAQDEPNPRFRSVVYRVDDGEWTESENARHIDDDCALFGLEDIATLNQHQLKIK